MTSVAAGTVAPDEAAVPTPVTGTVWAVTEPTPPSSSKANEKSAFFQSMVLSKSLRKCSAWDGPAPGLRLLGFLKTAVLVKRVSRNRFHNKQEIIRMSSELLDWLPILGVVGRRGG